MATVRAAKPEDVSAVLPMIAQICAMHESLDPARYGMLPNVVERYEYWLPLRAADPRSVFLVAEDSSTLTGFLVATVERNIPIYSLTEFGFIHDVWVEPEQRGCGVGQSLCRAALERFREMGVSQVRLETAAANEAARRMFASCGFRTGTIDMLVEL